MCFSEEGPRLRQVLQHEIAIQKIDALSSNRPRSTGRQESELIYELVITAGNVHVEANDLRDSAAKVPQVLPELDRVFVAAAAATSEIDNNA
jgi:hypothetical protein